MRKLDEDLECVQKVQNGDKHAFDALVIKYQFKIELVVKRYLRNGTEAKDVVQEVFLRAYQGLDRFRGDSAFYSWLYRIAINTAKKHLVLDAKERYYVILSEEEDLPFSLLRFQMSDFPESNAFTQELTDVVDSIVNDLSSDIRMSVILRDYLGMSYQEIASAMICPIGTVRSRIFRGREMIARRARPMLQEQGSQKH